MIVAYGTCATTPPKGLYCYRPNTGMYVFMACELPATGSDMVTGLDGLYTDYLNVPQACYKHSQIL